MNHSLIRSALRFVLRVVERAIDRPFTVRGSRRIDRLVTASEGPRRPRKGRAVQRYRLNTKPSPKERELPRLEPVR